MRLILLLKNEHHLRSYLLWLLYSVMPILPRYIVFVVYEEKRKNKIIKQKTNSLLTDTANDLQSAPITKKSFGEEMDDVYQEIHQE
jgi:hypothetical protein